MKTITGERFALMLKDPIGYNLPKEPYRSNIVVVFENYLVEGDILIDCREFNESIRLVSCGFSGEVRFNYKSGKINNHVSLYCESTTFQRLFLFECIFDNLLLDNRSFVEAIYMSECFVRQFWTANDSGISSLNIENATVGSLLLGSACKIDFITLSEATIDYVELDNTITERLYIQHSSSIRRVLIKNATQISRDIQIKNKSNIVSFEIEDVLLHDITCSSESNVGNLRLKGAQCGNILIYQSTVNNTQISNSKLGKVSIEYSQIEGFIVKSNSILMGVTLHFLTGGRILEVRKSTVFNFIVRIDKPLAMKIANSQIWELSIVNNVFTKDTLLLVSNTEIFIVKIHALINMGVLSLNNLKPLSKVIAFKVDGKIATYDASGRYVFEEREPEGSIFSLQNSDIGKTTFINCDLSAFDEFVFLNTKMLETFVADTILPDDDSISSVGEKNTGVALLEQQRLALGQFKKIYENRGDVVKSLEYHAQEMEVYRAYLKGYKWKSTRDFFDIFGERFNLWANRWSSNYGTNWLRATGVTIVTGWILFAVYCWTLGFRPGTDVGRFWELFSYSFEFINPLRKADFLEHAFVNADKEPLYPVTPCARIIDYAARIIMAYLVYQTIQAFRKFGKKAV